MTNELYKKHRPASFKAVVGQNKVIQQLTEMMNESTLPHSLLFTGGSGCGKTTLARILKTKLNCSDSDFSEMNCADFRGIDTVRSIRQRMGMAPIGGNCRIWLIDEAAKLSSEAQHAFLKILEDTPSHVYFFLCTTDPHKLLKTIITRCTEFKLQEISEKDLIHLIGKVCRKEGAEVSQEVAQRIAEVSEGSARKALVILHQIIGLETEADQLAIIDTKDIQTQAIQIARALMNGKTRWKEMAEILRGVNEEPESLRYMVLGYCSAVLLKSDNKRAFCIIDAFRDNFYDSKKAGLIASCYEVING